MARIVAELEKHKLITKENQLMFGPKKYAVRPSLSACSLIGETDSTSLQGLIQLPKHKHFRRIDIRLAPYHSYPYMLLGSTGDALLMKLLRHTAKQKGWCLNEYGMGDAVRFLPRVNVILLLILALLPMQYAKEDEVRCVCTVATRRLLTLFPQNPNGFKPNSLKIVKNEQEVFDLLGLPYVCSVLVCPTVRR